MNAISLFSNCGAGDIGYNMAGFNFHVMAELHAYRLDVAILNHPTAIRVDGDLRDTWRDVVSIYENNTNESLDLLAACPPCQGMSSAKGNKCNSSSIYTQDERNLLAVVISKVAKRLQPKIIVVENVPQFLTRHVIHPKTQNPITASNLLIELLGNDYKVYALSADLCEYGVPQTRKRSFLTFLRKDLSCIKYLDENQLSPFPSPSHPIDSETPPITVKAALEDKNFPKLDAKFNNKGQGLHFVPKWIDRRYEIVSSIPPNSGLSAWDNNTCISCGKVENNQQSAICSFCEQPLPRPVIQESNGTYRLIKGFKTSYKRMASDRPASTILTATGHLGSHSTIHPYENRVLSPAECAYLQTFPDDFDWGNTLKRGVSLIRAMIGEAVPPLFTKKHGIVLHSLLKEGHAKNLLSIKDKRSVNAMRRLNI